MFYVYILLSERDDHFYVGYSADLKSRIKQHFAGRVTATKHRLPLRLVYYEAFSDRLAARKQEMYYKTGSGRRVLNKRLYFLKNK